MKYIFLILAFLFPLSLSAQMVISEIMYDLEGSDGGREWVEIHNNSAGEVDISGWAFFENDVHHKLTSVMGDTTLSSGGYAVIADNAGAFLQDWPNFSGILFDSSFSLKNSGETIALRDSSKVEIDAVTYSPDWGAGGDGNSLQLVSGSGNWGVEIPTPNGENGTGGGVIVEQESENMTTSQESSGSISFPIEQQIAVRIKSDAVVTVGADSVFEGDAVGLLGEPLSDARFMWNFGNGETKEGRKVLHHYDYPGPYVVVLNVASGGFATSDRLTITALKSNIIISNVTTSFVELENRGGRELDLSQWFIRSGSGHFRIPNDTIILPHSTLILSSEVTGIRSEKNTTALVYPNGVVAKEYVEKTYEYVPSTEVLPNTQSTNNESIASIESEDVSLEAATLSAYEDLPPTLPSEKRTSMAIWLMAVLGVVGIAVVSVFLRGKDDEYITIIE